MQDLTALINEFKQIKEKDAISPASLGAILQKIVDEIDSKSKISDSNSEATDIAPSLRLMNALLGEKQDAFKTVFVQNLHAYVEQNFNDLKKQLAINIVKTDVGPAFLSGSLTAVQVMLVSQRPVDTTKSTLQFTQSSAANFKIYVNRYTGSSWSTWKELTTGSAGQQTSITQTVNKDASSVPSNAAVSKALEGVIPTVELSQLKQYFLTNKDKINATAGDKIFRLINAKDAIGTIIASPLPAAPNFIALTLFTMYNADFLNGKSASPRFRTDGRVNIFQCIGKHTGEWSPWVDAFVTGDDNSPTIVDQLTPLNQNSTVQAPSVRLMLEQINKCAQLDSDGKIDQKALPLAFSKLPGFSIFVDNASPVLTTKCPETRGCEVRFDQTRGTFLAYHIASEKYFTSWPNLFESLYPSSDEYGIPEPTIGITPIPGKLYHETLTTSIYMGGARRMLPVSISGNANGSQGSGANPQIVLTQTITDSTTSAPSNYAVNKEITLISKYISALVQWTNLGDVENPTVNGMNMPAHLQSLIQEKEPAFPFIALSQLQTYLVNNRTEIIPGARTKILRHQYGLAVISGFGTADSTEHTASVMLFSTKKIKMMDTINRPDFDTKSETGFYVYRSVYDYYRITFSEWEEISGGAGQSSAQVIPLTQLQQHIEEHIDEYRQQGKSEMIYTDTGAALLNCIQNASVHVLLFSAMPIKTGITQIEKASNDIGFGIYTGAVTYTGSLHWSTWKVFGDQSKNTVQWIVNQSGNNIFPSGGGIELRGANGIDISKYAENSLQFSLTEQAQKAVFIDMWKNLSVRFGHFLEFVYDSATDKFGFMWADSASDIFKEYEIKDVSYEQALTIYKSQTSTQTLPYGVYTAVPRFNIPPYNYQTGSGMILNAHANAFVGNQNLEVMLLTNNVDNGGNPSIDNLIVANTGYAPKLKAILGYIKVTGTLNLQCPALEVVFPKKIENTVNLSGCPNIRYECWKFMIDSAINTTTIGIKVHKEVYKKLVADESISEDWSDLVQAALAKNIQFTT